MAWLQEWLEEQWQGAGHGLGQRLLRHRPLGGRPGRGLRWIVFISEKRCPRTPCVLCDSLRSPGAHAKRGPEIARMHTLNVLHSGPSKETHGWMRTTERGCGGGSSGVDHLGWIVFICQGSGPLLVVCTGKARLIAGAARLEAWQCYVEGTQAPDSHRVSVLQAIQGVPRPAPALPRPAGTRYA